MGLIQKKDEKDVIDGIEIIGRGEGPDPDATIEVELHEGQTAEDISGKTAAKDEGMETEPDPELVSDVDDEDEDAAEDEEESEAEDVDKDAESEEADNSELDDDSEPATPKSGTNHGKLFIAIAVVAVIVAAIAGYILGSGGLFPKGTGATLNEDQLDTAVATWTYKGASHDITAREAIESQYSLDTVKNSDGTYPAPSAQMVLVYVQNQIMTADADSRGITVSDDEAASSVEKTLGTSDWATIAKQYGTSEDQAKEIVKEQVKVQKLRAEIVPDAADATAPEAPAKPADGNQDAASKDYADYIIKLAGDEWDADKGTWKSEDGTMATALKGQEFTADSATYTQAMLAYSAAYQAYQTESSKAQSEWTDYANGLFADADLKLYGVFA